MGCSRWEALDAAPDLAAQARAAGKVVLRDGQKYVEAESATLSGGAKVVTPSSAWTGESQWSGGAYVSGPDGARLTWSLPTGDQPRLVEPVADLVNGSKARAAFDSGKTRLGTVDFGAAGAQGNAPAPGELLPVSLPHELPAGATALTAAVAGGTGSLDAVSVTPLVSRLVATGDGGHAVALLTSVARTGQAQKVTVPGSGALEITTYGTDGRAVRDARVGGTTVTVVVPPGGFALVTR